MFSITFWFSLLIGVVVLAIAIYIFTLIADYQSKEAINKWYEEAKKEKLSLKNNGKVLYNGYTIEFEAKLLLYQQPDKKYGVEIYFVNISTSMSIGDNPGFPKNLSIIELAKKESENWLRHNVHRSSMAIYNVLIDWVPIENNIEY